MQMVFEDHVAIDFQAACFPEKRPRVEDHLNRVRHMKTGSQPTVVQVRKWGAALLKMR